MDEHAARLARETGRLHGDVLEEEEAKAYPLMKDVGFDAAGRMVLPERLRAKAQIGARRLLRRPRPPSFRIWNPEILPHHPGWRDRRRDRGNGRSAGQAEGARMSTPASPTAPHVPVLLDEVIAGLDPQAGETHVDGTFGAGGYTRAILRTGARVIAFDRDPDAIAAGHALTAENDAALTLIHDRFSRIAEALDERGVLDQVDGVTLDIGVSSMQLDQAERGFSFQADGPLDMRMEQAGMTAADFVNHADEAEIADVIHELGEDAPRAPCCDALGSSAARPITRTGQLADVVRRALGYRPHEKKDPATRTFQAIRIHLNAELDELEQGLAAAERGAASWRPPRRRLVVPFARGPDRKAFPARTERGDPRRLASPSRRARRGAAPKFRGRRQTGLRAGEAEDCPKPPVPFGDAARRPPDRGFGLGPHRTKRRTSGMIATQLPRW